MSAAVDLTCDDSDDDEPVFMGEKKAASPHAAPAAPPPRSHAGASSGSTCNHASHSASSGGGTSTVTTMAGSKRQREGTIEYLGLPDGVLDEAILNRVSAIAQQNVCCTLFSQLFDKAHTLVLAVCVLSCLCVRCSMPLDAELRRSRWPWPCCWRSRKAALRLSVCRPPADATGAEIRGARGPRNARHHRGAQGASRRPWRALSAVRHLSLCAVRDGRPGQVQEGHANATKRRQGRTRGVVPAVPGCDRPAQPAAVLCGLPPRDWLRPRRWRLATVRCDAEGLCRRQP
jgi:hypothetical protein